MTKKIILEAPTYTANNKREYDMNSDVVQKELKRIARQSKKNVDLPIENCVTHTITKVKKQRKKKNQPRTKNLELTVKFHDNKL